MKKYFAVNLLFIISLFCHELSAQEDHSDTTQHVTNQELQEEITELKSNFNEVKHGLSGFLITGYTNLTYHQDLNDPEISKFEYAGFSPTFLWKISDHLFFEAELLVEMQGGHLGGEVDHNNASTKGIEGNSHFDLGYTSMAYITNSGIILSAGKFLTPIGIYNERYHTTWINPLPIDPIGMGHAGVLPASELGIQVRGALQTGFSKVGYAIYLSNGPILDDGSQESDKAGQLIYSNFSDNNANKAIGGRFSWFPLPNSSLEVGVSGQYANNIGTADTKYDGVRSSIYAGDLNYYNYFGAGLLRISAQYTTIQVGNAIYENSLEEILTGLPVEYTFDNTSTFYFGSISMRPIKSKYDFLKKSEFIIRYENGKTPELSKWHVNETNAIFGYTYWIHIRSALKIAYSMGKSNIIYAQFALGF